MKGICPVCSQPVDVIESCFNTLDIHYEAGRNELKLCPGSGGRFDDLEDSASTKVYGSLNCDE